MHAIRFRLTALLLTLSLGLTAAQVGRPQGPAAPTAGSPVDAGWPRKVTTDGTTVTVYQPQVEKWAANKLEGRCAVSVQTKAAATPSFGVVWITARTEVDKEHRLVSLEDLKATKANFPAAVDKTAEYLDLIRQVLPQTARTVALDRLEANVAITQAEMQPLKDLKNEPPRIIVSTRPALLVLVDGKPALRQVDGSTLLRVINTRALILLDQANAIYYLRLMDRWMTANAIDGPWTVAKAPPATLAPMLKTFTDDPQVDLLDHLAADLAADFEAGTIPTIYVSTIPAELVDLRGEPDLAPIDGTKLLWAKNTTSQLLLDTASSNYYVLLSGRWFRAKALKGPWEYVPADKLPADFAKVPETHPRGDVLPSVAGTPQAKESVIANQVPQSATINRKEAKLSVQYDGEPKFQPVEGTKLQYAANAPTAVVQTAPDSYYAVENGVWFNAAAPTGPWAAAASVPEVIYTIPPSSPIYYVTYVYVYGATPEVIYTGYMPGYLGTCYAPAGVVVYGTGWVYPAWVGRYWYGRPWSYGFGARFAWSASGWGFGFSCGWGRPWWGPVGWHSAWGGTGWRTGWQNGWGGRFDHAHINNVNINNFNVYNRWNDHTYINHLDNRHTNIAVNKQTNIINEKRGTNNVLAARDGNVVRRVDNNSWEHHTNAGEWKSYEPSAFPAERRPQIENETRHLQNDWNTRRAGEDNWHTFRSAGGYFPAAREDGGYRAGFGGQGAFHGSYGGYRGAAHVGGGGRRR